MRSSFSNIWMKGATGLIFALLILAFIFFFGPQTDGYAPGSSTWVAKIDGRSISNTELASAFDRYRRLTGERGRLEDDEFSAVQHRQVLNIAAIELLSKRATAAGLAVSDNEVRCFIVNWHRGYTLGGERICAGFPEDYADRFRNFDIVFFSEAGGAFTSYYSETVRGTYQMSVDDFERHKRRELLARYYLDLIAGSVAVAPTVVRTTFERRNTLVSLEYLPLDASSLGSMEPTPTEIARFLEERADEVQAAYQRDPSRFAEPRQVELARIYIRKPDMESADFPAANARYEAALERARAGAEEFAEIARELSEIEREAEIGGDMGMRTRDSIAQDIWDATLELQTGDITGVEQEFAWNIVRVGNIVPARTRPIEEVAEEIAREILTETAVERANAEVIERGQRVLALAADSESLADASRREAAERREQVGGDDASAITALVVRTTPEFARERPSQLAAFGGNLPPGIEFPPDPADGVPGIGTSRELMRVAFQLTEEAPLHPTAITVDGRDFVVRLATRTEAPAEVPADAFTAIEAELRARIVAGIVGTADQQAGMALNIPGDFSPLVQQVLDDAIANRMLRLRSQFFSEQLDEI